MFVTPCFFERQGPRLFCKECLLKRSFTIWNTVTMTIWPKSSYITGVWNIEEQQDELIYSQETNVKQLQTLGRTYNATASSVSHNKIGSLKFPFLVNIVLLTSTNLAWIISYQIFFHLCMEDDNNLLHRVSTIWYIKAANSDQRISGGTVIRLPLNYCFDCCLQMVLTILPVT